MADPVLVTAAAKLASLEARVMALEGALASFASSTLEPEAHDAYAQIKSWLKGFAHLVRRPKVVPKNG